MILLAKTIAEAYGTEYTVKDIEAALDTLFKNRCAKIFWNTPSAWTGENSMRFGRLILKSEYFPGRTEAQCLSAAKRRH